MRTLALHKSIVTLIIAYVDCARGFDVSEEEDFSDFEEGLLDLLTNEGEQE